MWELDYKESWVPKNWCFWTVVLEKTLESPLDCKEIQPVHSKGNQSWIFIGKTDVEAETLILWPPDAENWLTGKDPDAGKDWRQEEKGTVEDEMVRWYHRLEQVWSWWWTGKPRMLPSMGVAMSWTRLSDWTEIHGPLSTRRCLYFLICCLDLSVLSFQEASLKLMAAVYICSDFGAQEGKICHCFHFFPISSLWSDGTRCHDLSFMNVEYQASFFTLLFHFHQEVL